ncbi:MAG: ribosome recycling factor [Candidatus Omnitrophica bacterium]|nr:ribosome recycling factor [Candidatus Omnitrophota bacterium]
MPVKEILKETEDKMKKTIDAAHREFNEVRTGRAHPGLIEGLHVECYGSNMSLKELASISVSDPKTIMIQPWDATVIPDLERAIANSNLGLTPNHDGKVIRLNIPPLSEERRKELIKTVKDMAEKSRVSMRTIRRDSNDKLKKMKSDKLVSEDEEFKAHESVQKLTDKYIKEIDSMLEDKEKQLLEH